MTSRTPLPIRWAVPIASIALLTAACASSNSPLDDTCPTDPGTGGSTAGSGGGDTSGSGASTGSGDTVTPQEVNARLHGCRKLRFETLGTLLRERGVTLDGMAALGGSQTQCQNDNKGNIRFCSDPNELCACFDPPCAQIGNGAQNNENATAKGICVTRPQTAAYLYQSGTDAFSVPPDDSRRSEKDGHTTASAMRLMDIFIQAAPEIVANMGDPQLAPACSLNGQNAPMFNPDGSCNEQAVSCLIGTAATSEHLLLCDLIVDKANPQDNEDIARKREIAVAALLSAAHTCE